MRAARWNARSRNIRSDLKRIETILAAAEVIAPPIREIAYAMFNGCLDDPQPEVGLLLSQASAATLAVIKSLDLSATADGVCAQQPGTTMIETQVALKGALGRLRWASDAEQGRWLSLLTSMAMCRRIIEESALVLADIDHHGSSHRGEYATTQGHSQGAMFHHDIARSRAFKDAAQPARSAFLQSLSDLHDDQDPGLTNRCRVATEDFRATHPHRRVRNSLED
jgi:hypothetical protein